MIEHTDDVARLQLLRDKPVLLIKGKDSVGENPGIVDLLSKVLESNPKVIILPDGHACHIVAQDQFIEELKKLIASAH